MQPLGHWIDVCPWKARLVLIFSISDNGEAVEAISVTDKKALLSRESGSIFVFWPGQWSSSVREITQQDRPTVLALF